MNCTITDRDRLFLIIISTNLELPFDGGRMEGALTGSAAVDAAEDDGMGGSDE